MKIHLLIYDNDTAEMEAFANEAILTDRLVKLVRDEHENAFEFQKLTRLPTTESRWSIVCGKANSNFSFPLYPWEIIEIDVQT